MFFSHEKYINIAYIFISFLFIRLPCVCVCVLQSQRLHVFSFILSPFLLVQSCTTAFIIYIIYKIISTIDKNTEFYEELIRLYKKYSIILDLKEKQISDAVSVENLMSEIEKINMLELDYKEIINKIDKN